MVREKFAVRLTPEERDRLEHLARAGRSPARVATRARILLKTSEGWSAPKVAQALDVAESSVYRIKRRFSEDGLDGVLQDRPQANRYRKLDDRAGAHLIALACTPGPEGYDHWTLRALAGRAVVGTGYVFVPRERAPASKKTPSSRGRGSSGAFPR